MKTRRQIIVALSIMMLLAGLLISCNSEVSEGVAADTAKTTYLSFDNNSKSISSTSIGQQYSIKPVSEVYWVYHAEKKDNAGTTGAMASNVYLPVNDAYTTAATELRGLDGTVGPFSVGKWQFTLIGYTDVADSAPNEDYITVNVKHGDTAETKYYYGKIYSASSSVITLSESTAANPQAVSVEVIFDGAGNGTITVGPGYFYWVNDKGGDVEVDSEVLKMHLTFAPTSGVATEKYITLDAVDYDQTEATKYRYQIANTSEATFELPAGDYDTAFAIERWSTGDNSSYISTLSGASGVVVKVYAKQTLVIDAQFLESSFGYVTFNGVTPAPVLVQRLVLNTGSVTEGGKRVTTGTSPQTVSHDGLSVTYPTGTILTSETRSAIDGKTSDATTGFVYTGEDTAGYQLKEGEANLGYELTVNVDQSNTTVLTIVKNIGAGRDVKDVYHNGNKMTKTDSLIENPTAGDAEKYNYNSTSGDLTLYVQHASPIDVVYVPAVVTDMVASVTHGSTVTTYATFEAAAAAALNGDTITLLKNVTLGSQRVTFNGGKTITLDLAGYPLLCGTDSHSFDISGANLTVKNGTINGNNKQVFNVYGRAEDSTGNYSVLTIASDAEIVNAGYGVCVFPASGTVGYDTEVNLNGSITGKHGVFVSGNLANASDTPEANDAMIVSNVININSGSSISTTDQAIAMNGGATVNVADGATLIGSEAIGLKRGTLKVTGGTLRATGDYVVPTANNNGTEASGAVVSITSTYNYARGIVANITGGTFVSANGHALSIQKTGAEFSENALAVTVSGGTFTAGSDEAAKAVYAAEGTATAFLTGGTYNTDPSAFVAIGYTAEQTSSSSWIVRKLTEAEAAASITRGQNTLYLKTFSEAFENITDGDTLTLFKDVTESISIKKSNLIIDLNGHKLTASDTSNNGYAIKLSECENVTIKNGSVESSGRIFVIGDHQYTIIKWKYADQYPLYGYHPLAPAKNIVLQDVNAQATGDKSMFYYTNIEDDITRGAPSNYVDNDLYGQYIYKTGYTTQDQSDYHKVDEVFTVCTDKDSVKIIGGSYSAPNGSMLGVMENKDGDLYLDVLSIDSGSFTDPSVGRFVDDGIYLVGTDSSSFSAVSSEPSSYEGKVGSVFFSYSDGSNDAIAYSRFGETVYLKASANKEKVFGQFDKLTVVYEIDGVSYTGALPERNLPGYEVIIKDDKSDSNIKHFSVDYLPAVAIYKTGQGGDWKNADKANDNDYATLKDALDSGDLSDNYTLVILKDFTVGDDMTYAYGGVNYKCAMGFATRSTIDFNGHMITYTGSGSCIVSSQQGGYLYFKDSSGNDKGGITATGKGSCVTLVNVKSDHKYFYGGSYIANSNHALVLTGGFEIILYGGKYESKTKSAVSGKGWKVSTLSIKGGTYVSASGERDISSPSDGSIIGGTFSYNWNNVPAKLASGKTCTENSDGTWTVK